jgi:hypothetical protein
MLISSFRSQGIKAASTSWNVSSKGLNAQTSLSMEVQQSLKLDNLVLDSQSHRSQINPYMMDSIAILMQSLIFPGLLVIYEP